MIRRWLERTFLDGEGELRRASVGVLAFFVISVVVLIVLLVAVVPTPLWLAWFASLGYVAGERSGSGSTAVESVAPPYISAE